MKMSTWSLLSISFMILCISASHDSGAAPRSYTNTDLLGTYEFSLRTGVTGTMSFQADGRVILIFPSPPGSSKEPLKIIELYNVKNDTIHFQELEINGEASDGKKSTQLILSVSPSGLTLKETTGKTKFYKRLVN